MRIRPTIGEAIIFDVGITKIVERDSQRKEVFLIDLQSHNFSRDVFDQFGTTIFIYKTTLSNQAKLTITVSFNSMFFSLLLSLYSLII